MGARPRLLPVREGRDQGFPGSQHQIIFLIQQARGTYCGVGHGQARRVVVDANFFFPSSSTLLLSSSLSALFYARTRKTLELLVMCLPFLSERI